MIKTFTLVLVSSFLITVLSSKKNNILKEIQQAKEAVLLHNEDKTIITQEKIGELLNEHPDVDNYTFLRCITTHNCYLEDSQIIEQYNNYLYNKNTDFNWISKLGIFLFIINFGGIFFILKKEFSTQEESLSLDDLREKIKYPIITDLELDKEIKIDSKIIDKINETEGIKNIRILSNYGIIIYSNIPINDDQFQEMEKNKYLIINYSLRKVA